MLHPSPSHWRYNVRIKTVPTKNHTVTTTTTTTILRPFFLDHPGEPVPERNFWTLWFKGRLTEADTPTIRLGATPSGLSSAQLHHPPIFYRPDALPAAQPTVSKHWRQKAKSHCYKNRSNANHSDHQQHPDNNSKSATVKTPKTVAAKLWHLMLCLNDYWHRLHFNTQSGWTTYIRMLGMLIHVLYSDNYTCCTTWLTPSFCDRPKAQNSKPSGKVTQYHLR